MTHIRLINAMLLAAVILPLISVVFSNRLITCGSKRNVHRLSCDMGVIMVETALYGRRNSETCSDNKPQRKLRNTHCSAMGVLERVRRICNSRKVCEINTKNISPLDPCRGTYKYVETTHTCLPAIHLIVCQNSIAFLHCYVGQVIEVYGARFGRGDKAICAYKQNKRWTRNIWCSNPTGKVAQRCNGKRTCAITASVSVFGNPCRGTYKYLELAYVCQYPLN